MNEKSNTDNNANQVKKTLDTTGLLCPEPVMMLHSAVRGMSSGDLVEVIATDPSTERDVPKFCTFLGHELLINEKREQTYYYLIKKA
ncbi:MAG: sulfurtransferase TusA [Cellvibrionaceae bacterium]